MSLYPWNRSIFYQIEFSEDSSYAFGFPHARSGPDMTYNLHQRKNNIKHRYKFHGMVLSSAMKFGSTDIIANTMNTTHGIPPVHNTQPTSYTNNNS